MTSDLSHEGRGDAPRPSLQDRAIRLAQGPAGLLALIAFALLEATVFPGPTEAMLIALVLVRRERAVWYAALATVASVAGGILGYYIGLTLYPEVIQPLLEAYGLARHAETLRRVYSDNMMLALVTSGYTPIPYMLYSSIAGAAELPVSAFVTESFIGRSLKYAPIAALAWFLGPRVAVGLRRYGLTAAILMALFVAIWMTLQLPVLKR